MLKSLRKLARKEDGASMVEYTVLLGLLLAVTLTVIGTVGDRVDKVWDDVDAAMKADGLKDK